MPDWTRLGFNCPDEELELAWTWLSRKIFCFSAKDRLCEFDMEWFDAWWGGTCPFGYKEVAREPVN